MFVIDDGSLIPPCDKQLPVPVFHVPEIEEFPVYSVLRSLGNNLTVTPDGLPPVFFSNAALGLARPLQLIFNLSPRLSYVPISWRM